MPGVSMILEPKFKSYIWEKVVVCWPVKLESEIGNVLIFRSESREFIKVDFPTPLCPEKTHVLPIIILLSSSILIFFFPETEIVL